jgi:energy-coupling factor transporter transmembrane protein EcfT
MKNKLEIHNDGINVYVTLLVNSHIIGKTILSIFVILLIGGLVYFPTTIPKEEIPSFIFPILIFGFLIFFFPVRYLFWNIYGKENLIINTKSLSHCNDYGVFKTNLKTYPHSRLGTGFEHIRTTDNIKFGKLVFIKYNEENNLPEHLYETSVLLDSENIKLIDEEISKLYEIELNDNFNFEPFSVN